MGTAGLDAGLRCRCGAAARVWQGPLAFLVAPVRCRPARGPLAALQCPRPPKTQELFKSGGGGYLLGPIDGGEGAACPTGVASRLGAPQTALVVLAGSGSAGRLQKTMSELLGTMRTAGEEVAGLFHIYVGVVSEAAVGQGGGKKGPRALPAAAWRASTGARGGRGGASVSRQSGRMELTWSQPTADPFEGIET
jgi:hypothetical protein